MTSIYGDPLFINAEVAYRREAMVGAHRATSARARHLLPRGWHLPRIRRGSTPRPA